MEPKFIKARLIEMGIGQTSIAKKLGISPQAVTRVLYGQSRSRRIEDAIAESTGVPVTTLFGHRQQIAA
jgi:transcriptional regulator with XRE-family HTH domain